jgi:hypothetical protein
MRPAAPANSPQRKKERPSLSDPVLVAGGLAGLPCLPRLRLGLGPIELLDPLTHLPSLGRVRPEGAPGVVDQLGPLLGRQLAGAGEPRVDRCSQPLPLRFPFALLRPLLALGLGEVVGESLGGELVDQVDKLVRPGSAPDTGSD